MQSGTPFLCILHSQLAPHHHSLHLSNPSPHSHYRNTWLRKMPQFIFSHLRVYTLAIFKYFNLPHWPHYKEAGTSQSWRHEQEISKERTCPISKPHKLPLGLDPRGQLRSEMLPSAGTDHSWDTWAGSLQACDMRDARGMPNDSSFLKLRCQRPPQSELEANLKQECLAVFPPHFVTCLVTHAIITYLLYIDSNLEPLWIKQGFLLLADLHSCEWSFSSFQVSPSWRKNP